MSSSRVLCCLPSMKRQNITSFFFRSIYDKTIIRFGFLISGIIMVSVRVISLRLRLRLRLITPTSTLIILDITKTSNNNSLCLLTPGKYAFYNDQTYCTLVAVSLHFMLLCAFCWMLCEGILLYCITTVVAANHEDKIKHFYLIGWGE